LRQAFFLSSSRPALVGVCILVAGCAALSPAKRTQDALGQIQTAGYEAFYLPPAPFPLFGAAPKHTKSQDYSHGKKLYIVIEGDGFAWANRYTPSDNPTPRHAAGLDLALSLSASLQPEPTNMSLAQDNRVVYLARPCQFIDHPRCAVQYWTDERFSPDIIQTYQHALDDLKQAYGASDLYLIGYSGGAYIALVLAAHRSDVRGLAAIAGLLDPPPWTTYHDVTPLKLTNKTQDLLAALQDTSILYICGQEDEIIPCNLTRDVMHQADSLGVQHQEFYEIPDASHDSVISPARDRVKSWMDSQ